MPFIYFDNFRGFAKTFLALKDFNFLVGENSTGKTSVLKLIGILSSPGFWRYREFGKAETNLGGFSEIVSSSKEADYFEIGLFGPLLHESENQSAIKLRFIEKDNFPFLKEICFIDDIINVQITLEGEILKYRFHLHEPTGPATLEFFQSWINSNGLNDETFSKTRIESLGILPILFQVGSLISSELERTIKIIPPSFLNALAWIEPNRAAPERIYYHQGLIFDPEGKHTPTVLKEILPGPDVKKILNRFGSDSGLYEDISIREVSGIPHVLKEVEAFEILVTVNQTPRNLTNVGYGVSQILPLIIETIARPDQTWFAIQQPEVHLHPRAQAAFGEFLYKSNKMEGQKFIIETHSDYIIDRFRFRINRSFKETKGGEGCNCQVLFFTKTEDGNELHCIEIEADGSYPESQPKEFRDFFIKEQLDLITI